MFVGAVIFIIGVGACLGGLVMCYIVQGQLLAEIKKLCQRVTELEDAKLDLVR